MNISFYVDAHVHCFEIDISELKKYFDEGFRIVCVSDDTSSSYETIRLADENPFIKPCIGVHPWLIDSTNTSLFFEMLNEKIDLVKCIGEVGLDKKFKPDTFHKQIVFFEEILKFAKEYDLVLNIHAAGAWREVYESLIRMDINRAYIHWYTGPMNLMYEITGAGYYIGLNPAWIIQEKHRSIVENAPINRVLTESDAPYKYRDLELNPSLVKNTVNYIAKTRGMTLVEVVETISRNYRSLFEN